MAEYTKAELAALQQKSLEAAKYFAGFCRDHGLTCYLCGGGCIGALRHGGFIPWDDDLDFFMPREDYEALCRLWPEEADTERYALERSDSRHIDRNLFVTVRDRNTTLIKPYQQDLDIAHGIALDVLPLDGCPDSRWQRKKQVLFALCYSLFCAQTLPEKHGRWMRWGSGVLLGIFRSPKLRYRIWRFCEKRMTQYPIAQCSKITELCSGPGYMKNQYPWEAFERAEWVPFEDTELPIPVGYDAYLRMAFGDYRQLPPEEKRVAHHECAFMDMERGYACYQGEKYGMAHKENDGCEPGKR